MSELIVIIDVYIVSEWMMWAFGDHKYSDIYWHHISRVSQLPDVGVIKIDLGHVFVSKWQNIV